MHTGRETHKTKISYQGRHQPPTRQGSKLPHCPGPPAPALHCLPQPRGGRSISLGCLRGSARARAPHVKGIERLSARTPEGTQHPRLRPLKPRCPCAMRATPLVRPAGPGQKKGQGTCPFLLTSSYLPPDVPAIPLHVAKGTGSLDAPSLIFL